MDKTETGNKGQEQNKCCLWLSAQMSKQDAAAGNQWQEKDLAWREMECQGATDAQGEKKGDNQQEMGGKKVASLFTAVSG